MQGDPVGLSCPKEGCPGEIVYNGNYFCSLWTYPFKRLPGSCNWALSHNDRTGDAVGTRDNRVWREIQQTDWFKGAANRGATTVREKIFDYLLDQDKPQTAIEVGKAIRASNYRTVQTTISRMVKVGLLEKAERGYRIR
jgi:hypothetical protein